MKTKMPCLSRVAFAKAISTDAPIEVRQHIFSCARCAAEAIAHRHVINLASKIPPPKVSASRIARIEQEVLGTMAVSSRPRVSPHFRMRASVAVAAALLVAMGATFFYRQLAMDGSTIEDAPKIHSGIPNQRGTIFAAKDAEYQLVSRQPDEIIRLFSGTITVAVDKLKTGERFRVIIGDATVEVKGTVFDVVAKDDQLQSVRVHNGVVSVLHPGDMPRLLEDDDIWQRPLPEQIPLPQKTSSDAPPERAQELDTAPLPSVPQNKPANKSTSTTHSRVNTPQPKSQTATTPQSQPETLFNSGWIKFKSGDFASAAKDFEHALRCSPRIPLHEDAAWWLIVARQRAGDTPLALAAMAQFVQLYPESSRSPALCAQLGRQKLSSRDFDEARQYFTLALKSTQSAIRRQATEGLQALDMCNRNNE